MGEGIAGSYPHVRDRRHRCAGAHRDAGYWSGVALGTEWHSLKLCGTVGVSGTWNLYRDAVKIVNGWTANTGATPVGRVDIGNAQTFTATVNFDDVVIDPGT